SVVLRARSPPLPSGASPRNRSECTTDRRSPPRRCLSAGAQLTFDLTRTYASHKFRQVMIMERSHSSFHLFGAVKQAMPDVAGDVIDKKEIGARIKRLRKEAGLRQWQPAEMIGATQPAIHMYERGVLPEPKRLLELARIGHTTVEWILTGRQWERG